MTFLEALAQVRERGKLIKEARDLSEFVSDIPKSLCFSPVGWRELHYYYVYDWDTDRILSKRAGANFPFAKKLLAEWEVWES